MLFFLSKVDTPSWLLQENEVLRHLVETTSNNIRVDNLYQNKSALKHFKKIKT